jgi:membrane-bound acyltransferase YfiQ involved in biofilm formation
MIKMKHAKSIGFSLLIILLCTGFYAYHSSQNSEFNFLIGRYPHTLGGIFTGNSTYYEYYQVKADNGEHYYRVIKSESGRVLKIQEISYSDYLVYTGKALDMAQSLVEKSGKLPPNSRLVTYTVGNLTVWLYYSLDGERAVANIENISNTITQSLASPGREFIIATVNLTRRNASFKRASFDELPKWVQNVVKELRNIKS